MSADVLPQAEPFSHHAGPAGVLVLHGFTGNPSSMRPLAEVIARAGYTVELPRLPGHGTSVEDMMTTFWDDWADAAEAAYDELSENCERVAVVGLSMGGTLTAHLAEVRPSVVGCVFINPLVKPPPAELLDGITQLLDSGTETFEAIGSDVKKGGVTELSYDATPLRQAQSLFEGVAKVNADLERIQAPSLLISSREDHVVTTDNGDELMSRVAGPIERLWLENSFHVATIDNDQEIVENATVEFLARVLS